MSLEVFEFHKYNLIRFSERALKYSQLKQTATTHHTSTKHELSSDYPRRRDSNYINLLEVPKLGDEDANEED